MDKGSKRLVLQTLSLIPEGSTVLPRDLIDTVAKK
jgi:hypothetical protein